MAEKNTRLRNLTWDDYGISKERYRELRYFCLQYAEKKKKAAKCIDCEQEQYLKDVRMIDEAAVWAATISGFPGAWNIILWSVTHNVGYDRLCQKYGFVPWCNPDFYAVRRAFFARLNDLQNEASLKNTLPGGVRKQ